MPILPSLLFVYLAGAAVSAVVTIRYCRALRLRRHEYLDRTDRTLLGCVGVLASLGWVAVVPVLILAWRPRRAPRDRLSPRPFRVRLVGEGE